MPYRLNGHDTRKLANPDRRESVPGHRYPPHYYMNKNVNGHVNGDVYTVDQRGHLSFVGYDREEIEKVWCPHGGLEIQAWKPIVQSGGMCHGVIKPMTYTDLIVMTGVRSCIYVRRGVILYEGWYDGRGLVPQKQPYQGEQPESVGMREIPAWLKDENGRYTATDSKVEKWVFYNKVYKRGVQKTYEEMLRDRCKSDDQTSRYGLDTTSHGGLYFQTDDLASITVPRAGHLIWRCVKTDPVTGDPPPECREYPRLPATDTATDTEGVSWNVSNVWGKREPDRRCDGVPTARPPIPKEPDYQWVPCLTQDCELIAKPDTPAGARLVDLGGGFVLFPYRWHIKDWKTHTWLGTVSAATALPGYAGRSTGKVTVFCCAKEVGTWGYPGGSHQYIYGSNAHSSRAYLSGWGEEGRTYVPRVANATATAGHWLAILEAIWRIGIAFKS